MISVSGLKEVEKSEWPDKNVNVGRAYRNREVVVLEYNRKIWWGLRRIKIRHLAIRTAKNVALYKFYDLMEIKNQICGSECEAVQFYPKDSDIMDGANMTHLFVFPENFSLPLNLKRKKNWHSA